MDDETKFKLTSAIVHAFVGVDVNWSKRTGKWKWKHWKQH